MTDASLFVDLYDADDHGHPAWAPLTADPRYIGAILKATEGVAYDTAWFTAQWLAVRAVAGARYGATFFRGAYHYLRFGDDGARQAAYYLRTVEAAGGWDTGDLIPIVDVERGNARSPNQRATAAQVIEVTTAFVAAVVHATDQRVMIYGRGAMRDLAIDTRFGADYLWNPGYTATMPSAAAQGWPDALVALWQYTDGTHNHTDLPTVAPGVGAVDTSVYRGADLNELRTTLVRQ